VPICSAFGSVDIVCVFNFVAVFFFQRRFCSFPFSILSILFRALGLFLRLILFGYWVWLTRQDWSPPDSLSWVIGIGHHILHARWGRYTGSGLFKTYE
jgi:hypothetical protein